MNKSSYCVDGTLSPEQRDIAMGIWYSLGMQGCEEESAGDKVRIKVYFPDEKTARSAADDFLSRDPDSDPQVYNVVQQDWNAQWRQTMKPAKIAPGFWVSPDWLPPPLKTDDHWIKIEPKMAFGTGHHETTRLASRSIISIRKQIANGRFLDIGTGSGILCFVADICGAKVCTGVEIDPDCRENLAENNKLNSHKASISFLIGTVDSLNETAKYEAVAMNMILTESTPVLKKAVSMLVEGGILIWSGILIEEKDIAIEKAKKAGCDLLREKSEHEWWCGIFRTTK